jgi:hyperosmotically inducible protein
VKIKLSAACFVMAILMAPLAHSADDSAPSTPHTKFGMIVKDSVITTKVKSKLTAEKMAYATNIKVETDSNGVVRLSGRVATRGEVKRVEEITRNTDGVNSVQNEIKVRS